MCTYKILTYKINIQLDIIMLQYSIKYVSIDIVLIIICYRNIS